MKRDNSHLLAEIAQHELVCESHVADRIAFDEASLLRHLLNVQSQIARIVAIMETGATDNVNRDGETPVWNTVRNFSDANQVVVDLATAQRLANRLVATIEHACVHPTIAAN